MTRARIAAIAAMSLALAACDTEASLGGPAGAAGSGAVAGGGGDAGSGAGGVAGQGGGGTSGGAGGGAGGAGAGGAGGAGGTAGSAGSDAGAPGGCPSGTSPTVPIVHLTLDDAGSIVNPAIGAFTGEFMTMPANDFVTALEGNGLRLDDPEDFVRFPMIDTGVTFFVEHGALDLCYRPDYEHTDGIDHGILATTGSGVAGLRIRKAGASNGNAFQVIALDINGAFGVEANIPSSEYSFTPGVWTRITVSWDFNVAAGARNIFVYFDGIEAFEPSPPVGPVIMQDSLPGELVYLGTFGPPQGWSAAGVLDEVYIYDRPITP